MERRCQQNDRTLADGSLRGVFGRLGFDDKETVCLIVLGSHRTRLADCSSSAGTPSPSLLKRLLEEEAVVEEWKSRRWVLRLATAHLQLPIEP